MVAVACRNISTRDTSGRNREVDFSRLAMDFGTLVDMDLSDMGSTIVIGKPYS